MSDWLNHPRRLCRHQRARFPVHSGHIGDSPGQSVWLAMPQRLPRLPSRSPFLGYQKPLLKRLACRHSDATSEPSCLSGSFLGEDLLSEEVVVLSFFHSICFLRIICLLCFSCPPPGSASQ